MRMTTMTTKSAKTKRRLALEEAVAEAKRFVRRSETTLAHANKQWEGDTGARWSACDRSSLDLSRSLAAYRKSPPHP